MNLSNILLDIKKVRKELSLTQQQFADKINVPIGRVNAWEMRGSTPKVEDYNAIIKLLEINKIVLLNQEKTTMPTNLKSQIEEKRNLIKMKLKPSYVQRFASLH